MKNVNETKRGSGAQKLKFVDMRVVVVALIKTKS